ERKNPCPPVGCTRMACRGSGGVGHGNAVEAELAFEFDGCDAFGRSREAEGRVAASASRGGNFARAGCGSLRRDAGLDENHAEREGPLLSRAQRADFRRQQFESVTGAKNLRAVAYPDAWVAHCRWHV